METMYLTSESSADAGGQQETVQVVLVATHHLTLVV
jgi:hypothetical protein